MWGTMLSGLLARPWERRLIGMALAVLTIVFFLFNLRRAGERAGRAAERLAPWRLSPMPNVRCWTKPAAVLATAMISLTGCATGSSEQRSNSVCPPVVAYNREEQRRVADEIDALPEGSVIAGWLADYMVLRGQLRVCK